MLRGVDASTAAMSGLLNTPVPAILEHARLHDRVVVMFDSDYVALHVRGVPYAGIACFPGAPEDIGFLVESLALLDGVFEADELENWLEHL